MKRRRFLQLGLGGTALLAVGAIGLGLQPTRLHADTPTLKVFSPKEYAILHAMAQRICPGGDGLPSIDDLQVCEKLDTLFSRMSPRDQKDIKLALNVFENAVAGLVLEGRVTPFTQLDPKAQDDVLERWRDSSLSTARVIFRSVRDLVAGTYWGDPRCFAAVGYPGPPALGG